MGNRKPKRFFCQLLKGAPGTASSPASLPPGGQEWESEEDHLQKDAWARAGLGTALAGPREELRSSCGAGAEAAAEPSTLWPQQLDKGACLRTLTLRILKGWASLPPHPHPHPHLEMTFGGRVIPLNPKLSGVTTRLLSLQRAPPLRPDA